MYDTININSLIMRKIMFYWAMNCTIHMCVHLSDDMFVLCSEGAF